MVSAYKPEDRATVLSGYPKDIVFTTPEALDAYFSGDKITCLLCGKSYRTLGVHLRTMHDTTPDEYRERYGIPWSYGLSCAETTALHSEDALNKLANGILTPGSNMEALVAAPKRKRQPVRDTLTKRNLEVMNTGKSGAESERRRGLPKKGTPEYNAKMKARPVSSKQLETLRTYWLGREQTNEHVFKRTGHHKKEST